MYKIETVHLEITDKCNASCPQCARNVLGGKDNPYLARVELSLNDIKKIFPPQSVAGLKRLYMCGNYGDALVARDTLEIFRYFRHLNPSIHLALNTNGHPRNKEWWGQLAKVLGSRGNVKFGIDGLADTHSIYRRNTNFVKIMENARAFIAAGGEAIWEFIVFRHNEHQVEEAKKMAKELNFSKFTVKKTGRFFSNNKLTGKDVQEVCDPSGTLQYYLEKPIQTKYQNKSLQKEDKIVAHFGSMENYLDQTEVNCKAMGEKSIYISAEGLAFPCCWTANQMYLWYFPPRGTPIWKLIKNSEGKLKGINAKDRPLGEIVKGDFFRKIKESWSCPSVSQGKLKVCAKTCGKNFDQFGDQYR